MKRAVALVLTGLAIVLCGCGTQAASRVVDLQKSSYGALVDQVPACAASQLRAVGEPRVEATDVRVDVVLTNASATECDLYGLPNAMQHAVRLVRTDGSLVKTKVLGVDTTAVLVADPLKPHGLNDAHLTISWSNWCEANPGTLQVRIALPYNPGVLTGSFNRLRGRDFVPACLHPRAASTLQVLQ